MLKITGVKLLVFTSRRKVLNGMTQLYAQYVRYCKLSVIMWSSKNLKSRIPLCSPCDSRIPTPQKHEIPLPLVTVIPTSRPCFQIKSRISRQKNAKSRIPPNLLGTLLSQMPCFVLVRFSSGHAVDLLRESYTLV